MFVVSFVVIEFITILSRVKDSSYPYRDPIPVSPETKQSSGYQKLRYSVMKYLAADGEGPSPPTVLDLSFIDHEGLQNQRLRSKIEGLTRIIRPFLPTLVAIAFLVHIGLGICVLQAVSLPAIRAARESEFVNQTWVRIILIALAVPTVL